MIQWAPLNEQGIPAGQSIRDAFEISPRQARELIARRQAIILDCRTTEEWEHCHIPGSEHIPLHELEQRLDELDDDTPILTLCHHGRRSVTAALTLQARGRTSARSIFGGIDLWALDIDPSIPRYERDASGCRTVS